MKPTVTMVLHATARQNFGQTFAKGEGVKSYENEPGRGGLPPLFLSLTIEVSGQLQAVATLTLVKEPLVLTRYEAGWAPEVVWMLWSREKSLEPVRNCLACSLSLYHLSYRGSLNT
jgi:hypothetical protein